MLMPNEAPLALIRDFAAFARRSPRLPSFLQGRMMHAEDWKSCAGPTVVTGTEVGLELAKISGGDRGRGQAEWTK